MAQAALRTFNFPSGTIIAQAFPKQNAPVTVDSNALEVMTDLTQVKAATTSPQTSLAQAEQIMIYQGVRLLFVVSDMPSVEGLITSTDLHGERALRVVNTRKIHYDELCVADVMTELSLLDAIDYDELKTARVAAVIATIRQVGRQHLLVVQKPDGTTPGRIRGVISRTQVERQLGEPIDLPEIARSFAEIGEALS